MAKDWYKKKKADSLDDRLDAGQEPVAEDSSSPELSAEYAQVLELIQELEEGDRTVLLLKYVEGLPPREIAEVLNEAANTVSVRINRAEERLRLLAHT